MKTQYSFTILRYMHDIVTQEFVNIGVVLFAPETRFLNAICTSKYSRLSKMFLDIDSTHFKQLAKFIQTKLEEEGERLISELPLYKLPKSVSGFATKILPIDDSSLQFSKEGYGITENPQITLENLYKRYVEKYYEKSNLQRRNKDDVWRTFKKPLEEKGILKELIPHNILGTNYTHEFMHSWKNEKWHLNEPISFDLLDSNSMAEKANKWLGRATSLHDGANSFHLNILLGAPQDEKLKKSFEKVKNILHSMPCEHDFIKEDEANDFAENLKTDIENHKRHLGSNE